MTGLVTKKHFFQIASAFGIKKACKVLFSSQPVALLVLISD